MGNNEYKQRRPTDDLTSLDDYTVGDLVRYLRFVKARTGEKWLSLRLMDDGAFEIGQETRDQGWLSGDYEAYDVHQTAATLKEFAGTYRTDWEALYRGLFVQDENYDITWVDCEGWRDLDDERHVVGGEFPRAISEMRLHKGGANAWEAQGLRRLLGESEEKRCALDHIEATLPLLRARLSIPQVDAFWALLVAIRGCLSQYEYATPKLASQAERFNKQLDAVAFDEVSRPIHEALVRCIGFGRTGVSLGFVCAQLRKAIKAAEDRGSDVANFQNDAWSNDIIHSYLSGRF